MKSYLSHFREVTPLLAPIASHRWSSAWLLARGHDGRNWLTEGSTAWLGSRLVEFGRGQQVAAVFAASDQDLAVSEQGAGVTFPGCVH